MRVFICLVMIILAVSCSLINRDKAKIDAQQSGIIVDTIICGICFNDNPDEVNCKIQDWAKKCPGNDFVMHFTYPKRINKYEWEIGNLSYYNDSLYSISLHSEIPSYMFRECMEDLDSLFSHKYGKSFSSDFGKSLEWYKGNLTINISTHENLKYTDDYISISYTDSRYYDKIGTATNNTISKDSEDYRIHYEYSKDYWEKTYKQEENRKLHEATKYI